MRQFLSSQSDLAADDRGILDIEVIVTDIAPDSIVHYLDSATVAIARRESNVSSLLTGRDVIIRGAVLHLRL